MPNDGSADQTKVGLTIDRLSLKLSGLTEADGRRLALRISEGLAADGLDDWTRVGTVSVHADARAAAGLDRLSEQIVAEIVRQIRAQG